MSEASTSSRPESFTIEELLAHAEAGKIRVPEFQRGFRWASKEVIELFDSIRRGYPIGSALLWRRPAERASVRLGDLTIDAPKQQDALWVVDGQQRVTTLVNAISPSVDPGSVFAVAYLPAQDRFVRSKEVRAELAIALPDLFDISRLFTWLQSNPDALEYAEQLQRVTTILRGFALQATVVIGGDEEELRRIFGRINTAGKPLTAAEVFDAINRTTDAGGQTRSLGNISDTLAAHTTFGVLPTSLVHQALLVRRHPDISRSPNAEFEPDRRASSDFPEEGRDETFVSTERALHAAIAFLQREVGVPHITFLPQNFLLLVTSRFFAFFPEPEPRTTHLLTRWFWRAASRASRLGLTGATNTTRGLAGLIRKNDEHGSIQRLLEEVALVSDGDGDLLDIDFRSFRTNQAASKIVLCAMWARGPRSLQTGEVISDVDLAAALAEADTPGEVVPEVFPRARLRKEVRLSVGNRLILEGDDKRFLEWVADGGIIADDAIFASHFVNRESLSRADTDPSEVVENRERTIAASVETFIRIRAGLGMDDTPALGSLNLDEVFG